MILNPNPPVAPIRPIGPISPRVPILLIAFAACLPAAAQSSSPSAASLTGEILVVVLGLTLSGVCVLMHYEALGLLTRILPRLGTRPRPRVLVLMLSLLAVHQAEVWMFAWGYFFAVLSGVMGDLLNADRHLLTYAYFSTTTYTTVGYGDITPTGPLRFLAAVEALTGFLLVTWSASFTYLEMQRFWRDR